MVKRLMKQKKWLKKNQKREVKKILLPEEELKETERGPGLIDPEQLSGGLLLQINGFPAILHS